MDDNVQDNSIQATKKEDLCDAVQVLVDGLSSAIVQRIKSELRQEMPNTLSGHSRLEPDLQNSDWYNWDRHQDFPEMKFRGVYIIASAKRMPKTTIPWLSSNVIYIGETYGQTKNFKKRLREFHQAAQNRSDNHAGGVTYFGKSLDPSFSSVYFSVIPSELPDQKLNRAWIHYLERKLISEYETKYGRLPKCNSE